MLVLTRKLGEKVVIGEKVTLSVVAVKGRQVRIGVGAPRDVAVWRERIQGLAETRNRSRMTGNQNRANAMS